MFLLLIGLVNAQCKTISLQNSTACPELKAYSVQPPAGVNSVAEFDEYVTKYRLYDVGSSVCPEWSPSNATFLRYGRSLACSYFVAQTKANATCQVTGDVLGICRTNAIQALGDVTFQCKNATQQLPTVTSYANGLKDENCFVGIGSDAPKKCGFDDVGSYCFSNPNELCCAAKENFIPAANSTVATTTATSDTATTATAAPSATQSSTVQPDSVNVVFIGVAIAGALLLITLIICIVFFRRQKKKTVVVSPSKPTVVEPEPEPLMVCVFDYQASLLDELDLDIGDRVRVLQRFDDGWALGFNMNSGKQGVFPIACVEPGITGVTTMTKNKRVSSIIF